MDEQQSKDLTECETIPIPLDRSFGLEINDRIKNQTWVPIDKNSLVKVGTAYHNHISKGNLFVRKILPDMLLGFSTTLIGAILSGVISGIRFPNVLAYFCYCVFPPISVALLFAFILMKTVFYIKEEDFIRITKEYILDPAGYGQSGEKNE